MASGLKEFREVFADFKGTASLAMKGALAVPLVAAWVNLGPPPKQLVALLTPLAQLLALIWVFHFWGRLPAKRLDRRMKASLAGFCLLGVLSLFLNHQFTYTRGDGVAPLVEGFQIRQDVLPVLRADYTAEDALRGSQFDAEEIWTKGSVAVMRVTLPGFWVTSYVCLSVYLAAFIISHRRAARGART
jgi:hypothetical protein